MQEQKKITYTPLQALQKIKIYCAYQERCHSEVETKLYLYGLTTTEVGECICTLIEENYLNEERYAIAYAGGKCRINHWGKQKISYTLKQKKVSDYCIKKALLQITDDDYEKAYAKNELVALASAKGEKNSYTKKRKISDYLRSRGYETYLIQETLKNMRVK